MGGLDTHTHRTTTVTLAAHARRGLIIAKRRVSVHARFDTNVL